MGLINRAARAARYIFCCSVLYSSVATSAVSAQSVDSKAVEFSGYFKNLWQYSQAVLEPRPYSLNTTRLRLTADAKKSVFRAHVDYDHELLAGSYFRTRDHILFGLPEPRTWLELDRTFSTRPTTVNRQRLHRLWGGIENEAWLLRFGRQRVAWGTGKLWNPTDVLNPYNPVSIERDERRGVDAFYARGVMGDLSQLELSYAPETTWSESVLLGRLRTNWRDYDLSVMGGKVAASTHSYMAGGDFAGNLFDGTLHGEWSYTDNQIRTGFWRAGVGYDYTFTSEAGWGFKDTALTLEYYHNGAGELDSRRYNFLLLLGGRETTLARNYLGFTASKDLHPLVKAELVVIQNIDDGSSLAGPSLQWNALDNLYLTGGFQRFGGPRRAELGRNPNLAYLQAQYFF